MFVECNVTMTLLQFEDLDYNNMVYLLQCQKPCFPLHFQIPYIFKLFLCNTIFAVLKNILQVLQ